MHFPIQTEERFLHLLRPIVESRICREIVVAQGLQLGVGFGIKLIVIFLLHLIIERLVQLEVPLALRHQPRQTLLFHGIVGLLRCFYQFNNMITETALDRLGEFARRLQLIGGILKLAHHRTRVEGRQHSAPRRRFRVGRECLGFLCEIRPGLQFGIKLLGIRLHPCAIGRRRVLGECQQDMRDLDFTRVGQTVFQADDMITQLRTHRS